MSCKSFSRLVLALVLLLLCICPLFGQVVEYPGDSDVKIQRTAVKDVFYFVYNNPFISIIFAIFLVVGICASIILFGLNRNQQIRNKLLNDANFAKSDFLSNMSHELRTPLSAIIGLNRIISENVSDEERVRSCSEKIALISVHLQQLINNVLDMSVIDQGNFELQEKPFSLAHVINTVTIISQELLGKKDINFIIESNIDMALAQSLVGDELRLKQVIINILENAIKYNKINGNIVFRIDEKNISDDKILISFSIEDTGLGISADGLEKIRQLKNGNSSNGLGLQISTKILSLMNSELKIKSVVGKGSTISFDIVFKKETKTDIAEKAARALISSADYTGKKFLVAEDEEINAEVIKYTLETMNASVDVVTDGKLCCQVFSESKENYYYAILMDIRMPVMNGYEASSYIRALSRADAKTVKIIALSANIFKTDKEKSIEAGMNAHCSKPINVDELIKCINNTN